MVQTGITAENLTEIVSGLEAWKSVVTSGQFMLDAESNLRGGMENMKGMEGGHVHGPRPRPVQVLRCVYHRLFCGQPFFCPAWFPCPAGGGYRRPSQDAARCYSRPVRYAGHHPHGMAGASAADYRRPSDISAVHAHAGPA